VLVEVDGLIGLDAESNLLGQSSESMVARIREQLDRARADSPVDGVLLRIDSPGGSATASDVIYTELLRFKREAKVPVVAHMLGIAASGGYYVAMAADEIVAEPTTVTGSIGVIFVNVNFSGLMERFGVKDQTITAGRYKDAGSSLRPQTSEERAMLQSVIDDLHERFRAVVATGRPRLSRERVDALADGRLYSAPQALENGLIDGIGDIEEAVLRLEEMAVARSSTVVSYHRPNEWRQNLYTRPPAAPAGRSDRDVWTLLDDLSPGFHYVWWPGAIMP
jgi:protease-4